MTAWGETSLKDLDRGPASDRDARAIDVAVESLASPEMIATTLRAGAVLIVLFQTAYLFLDMNLPAGAGRATLPLHLVNIATGVLGFFLALSITHAFLDTTLRYRIPLEPPLIALASVALSKLITKRLS